MAPTVVHKDRLAVEAAYPSGVRVLPDVPYWTPRGFRPLTMDIYLPPASIPTPATGFPVIMYIHGGDWSNGSSRSAGPIVDFPALLGNIAARGYVVTSVNYRLSGEAPWPAQAHDIKAAIKYLRLHAGTLGIDPRRFVAWGESAGGHLSAIASLTCGVAELQPQHTKPSGNPSADRDEIVGATVSDCVQGAVAWYGVFNMASISQQARGARAMSREERTAPEWRLLGCFKDECRLNRLRSASPVSYVRARVPPMLLVVGDADTSVPAQQTVEMAQALNRASVQHELVTLSGVNHNLIGPTHQSTRDATQRALDATLRFIDRLVGLPPLPRTVPPRR